MSANIILFPFVGPEASATDQWMCNLSRWTKCDRQVLSSITILFLPHFSVFLESFFTSTETVLCLVPSLTSFSHLNQTASCLSSLCPSTTSWFHERVSSVVTSQIVASLASVSCPYGQRDLASIVVWLQLQLQVSPAFQTSS